MDVSSHKVQSSFKQKIDFLEFKQDRLAFRCEEFYVCDVNTNDYLKDLKAQFNIFINKLLLIRPSESAHDLLGPVV